MDSRDWETRVVGKQPPRVTVAVPTWNGARFIRSAIDSVLGQTFTDFELIVIDDGSDDDTIPILSSIEDSRIRVEKSPARVGLVGNWNRCLAAATGDYVTIFHQDDVMAPDNLARKVAMLDAHPSVAFVHSNVLQIAADGSVVADTWYAPPAPGDDRVHDGPEYFARLFSGENLVCCPTVMLRRVLVAQHGGFLQQLPFTADWEMWMRLSLFHDVAYIDQPLVSYRRHAGAETERFQGARRLEQCFMAKDSILQRHAADLPAGNWRQILTDQYAKEADRRSIDAVLRNERSEAQSLVSLSHSVRTLAAGYGETPWILDLLEQTRDREREMCNERLATLEAEVEELRALRMRCRELAARERDLLTSISWRLTGPLRFVYRLVTRRSS